MNNNWKLPEPFCESDLALMGENFIAEIRSAFAGVSIKGGVTLTEAYAIDDFEIGATRAEARAQDTYTDWTKINIPSLDPGDSALCFVDPIGFRFHLPAYMCHAIKQNLYTVTGYIETEPLIDRFQIANDYGKRMTAEFDQAQFAACARFLIYVAEEQFTRESEYCEDTERLAKDMYDYQSPLRIMRVAWWQFLSEKERLALLARWPVLKEDPY